MIRPELAADLEALAARFEALGRVGDARELRGMVAREKRHGTAIPPCPECGAGGGEAHPCPKRNGAACGCCRSCADECRGREW